MHLLECWSWRASSTPRLRCARAKPSRAETLTPVIARRSEPGVRSIWKLYGGDRMRRIMRSLLAEILPGWPRRKAGVLTPRQDSALVSTDTRSDVRTAKRSSDAGDHKALANSGSPALSTARRFEIRLLLQQSRSHSSKGASPCRATGPFDGDRVSGSGVADGAGAALFRRKPG